MIGSDFLILSNIISLPSFQPLEVLIVADNKLRQDIIAIFDCLGTNETVTTLDIR